MELAVLSKENKELKKIELKDSIFKAPIRRQLIFDAVQMYLANQRQGTASAKFRHEVAGSTRKIYRQKGTGNARHGSIRANIFVGGGLAHPPRPRDWSYQMPQTAKQTALVSALSVKVREGNLFVVEDLEAKEIKTKAMAKQLEKWRITKCVLVVDKGSEKLWKSVRNIANVSLITADNLNAFSVIAAEKVVMTVDALKKLEARLAKV